MRQPVNRIQPQRCQKQVGMSTPQQAPVGLNVLASSLIGVFDDHSLLHRQLNSAIACNSVSAARYGRIPDLKLGIAVCFRYIIGLKRVSRLGLTVE